MTTTDDLLQPLSSLPGLDNHDRGELGDRRLVTVQTIDIGRLPPQVLPLSQHGGLVLVSGRGPKDSNGSGKTTAQAAIDLLCMSHAWSPRSGRTGEWAAGLVFDPPSSRHKHARADEGWIIGGFHTPGKPADTGLTVVARIQRTGDPKLRFRVLDGLHNVEAATLNQHIEGAKQLWSSGSSERTYSAQAYFEKVLGNQPRSAGYVNQRGNRESPAITMFTADLRKVTEAQIADDLLELTGLDALVSSERKQRAGVASQRVAVDRKREAVQVQKAEADSQLATFDARSEALQLVGEAAQSRKAWAASRAAEAVTQAADLAQQRQQLLTSDRAEQLRDDVADAKQKVGRLQDTDELQRAHDEAAAAVERLRPKWQQVQTAVQEARSARDRIDGRHKDPELVELAANASGRPEQMVAADLDEAEAALDDAKADRTRAAADVERTEDDLKTLLGAGSAAAQLLADAGIDVDVLADVADVEDDARDRWDALLAPFGATLVVAPDDLEAAVQLLADQPGQTLTCSAADTLPAGIAAAPTHAAGLLHALDDGAGDGDGWVTTGGVPVHVVSGFDAPQVGRSAREAAARQAVAAAKDRMQTAAARVTSAQQDVELFRNEHKAVVAAARRSELAEQLADANQALAEAEQEVQKLAPDWQQATGVLQSCDRDLEQRQQLLDEASKQLESAQQLLAAEVDDKAAALTEQISRWNVTHHVRRLADISKKPDLVDAVDGDTPSTEAAAQVAAAADTVIDTVEPAADGSRPNQTVLQRRSTRLLQQALHLVGVVESADGSMSNSDPLVPATVQAAHRQWLQQRDARHWSDDGTSPSSQAYQLLVSETVSWLEPRVDLDNLERQRVETRLSQAEQELEAAEDTFRAQQASAESYRASVQMIVEQKFDEIGQQFAQRVAASGGRGELRVRIKAATSADGDAGLDWEVTPCWSMHPQDDPVPYRHAKANTAQEKIRAIQLVLAAFSTNGAPGRVLLLDELASNLGQENFTDVVAALARAAENEGLTILATLQDTHLQASVNHAQQLLWFRYRSHDEMLNDPTVALLQGPDETVGLQFERLQHEQDGWLELAAHESTNPVWDGSSPLIPDDASALFDGEDDG